jgi:hypothetical protein
MPCDHREAAGAISGTTPTAGQVWRQRKRRPGIQRSCPTVEARLSLSESANWLVDLFLFSAHGSNVLAPA